MLSARIELRGEELFCADTGEGGMSTVRPLAPKRWRACAAGPSATMRRCVRERCRRWSRSGGTSRRFSTRATAGSTRFSAEHRRDRVRYRGARQPEERERILLDVPWELLAPNGIFLAEDDERLFRVTRRLGGAARPRRRLSRSLVAVHGGRGRGAGHPQLRAGRSWRSCRRQRASLSTSASRRAARSSSSDSGSRRTGRSRRFTSPATGISSKATRSSLSKSPEGGLDLRRDRRAFRGFWRGGQKAEIGFPVGLPHWRARRRLRLLSSPWSARESRTRSAGTDRSMTPTRSALPRRFMRNWRGEAQSPMPRRERRGALLRAHLADPDRGPALASGASLCRPARRRRALRRGEASTRFSP